MKKAVAILLAVLVISQMMVNVGIGIYYHLNKEYIVKQLCINKNNLAIHCDGHCYLSKQLKMAEQSEKQSAKSFKDRNEIFTSDNYNAAVLYFPAYKVIGFVCYTVNGPCAGNYNLLIKPPVA